MAMTAMIWCDARGSLQGYVAPTLPVHSPDLPWSSSSKTDTHSSTWTIRRNVTVWAQASGQAVLDGECWRSTSATTLHSAEPASRDSTLLTGELEKMRTGSGRRMTAAACTCTVVTFDSCIMSGNSADVGYGGGIYVRMGDVTFNACIITGNHAAVAFPGWRDAWWSRRHACHLRQLHHIRE
jgi:hypothetical protein